MRSPVPRGQCYTCVLSLCHFRFLRLRRPCLQMRRATASACPARPRLWASGKVAGHGHDAPVVPLEGEVLVLSGAHAIPGGSTPIWGDFTPILQVYERGLAGNLTAS